MSGLVEKVLDNEMGDEALPPPPFSYVYGPAFTYLYIISHHMRLRVISKKIQVSMQPSDKSVRFTSFYLKQKAAVICKEQITNSKYQNMYKCIQNDGYMYDVTCTDNYM